MSEKVKNHFVPKFYLKQFVKSDLISLYHIDSEKFIFEIPSEDQAQKKRLYGDNSEMEDAFAQLESDVAPILKNIINSHRIPSKANMKYFPLMNFVILQNERTVKSIDHADHGIEQMLKEYLKHIPEFKDFNQDEYEIRMKNAFVLSTGEAIPIAIESYDLEPLIILNKTKYPFITSDNPCVKYNQFAKHVRWYNDGRGFGIMGLQIFLPITEDLMIAFYDKDIYQTNLKGKKKNIVEATKEDVLRLNSLQYICCDECLYFGKKTYIKDIVEYCKNSSEARHNFVPSTQEFKGEDGYLLVHTEAQVKISLDLSFFYIKNKYKKFDIKGLSMGGLQRKTFSDFYIKTHDQAIKKFGAKHVTRKLFDLLLEKQYKYGKH